MIEIGFGDNCFSSTSIFNQELFKKLNWYRNNVFDCNKQHWGAGATISWLFYLKIAIKIQSE